MRLAVQCIRKRLDCSVRHDKHWTAADVKFLNDSVNDSAADRARALFLVRSSSSPMCLLCWTIHCSQNDLSLCLSWIRAAFITWRWETHRSQSLEHVIITETLFAYLLLVFSFFFPFSLVLSCFSLSSQSPALCLLSAVPRYSISSCLMSFSILFCLVHLFISSSNPSSPSFCLILSLWLFY